MTEHRTIPQRLNDHDRAIDDLLDRVIELEQALAIRIALAEDVDTKGRT